VSVYDPNTFCISQRSFAIGIAIAGLILMTAVVVAIMILVSKRRRKNLSTTGSSIYSGPYTNTAYSHSSMSRRSWEAACVRPAINNTSENLYIPKNSVEVENSCFCRKNLKYLSLPYSVGPCSYLPLLISQLRTAATRGWISYLPTFGVIF